MKTYYASRAPYYDAVYEKPERQRDIAFLRDHLPARFARRSVIEVACGTGYWSQFIAPVCSTYLATDGVAQPLEFARQRPGLAPSQCIVADAYALPPELGRFDGAFAGLWFSHVPIERRTEFFASLHGLLEPGARIVLIDNSPVQCQELPIAESDASGNTYQHRPLRDGSVHRVLKNFPSEAELRNCVARFDARNSRFQCLENFWLFEYELPNQP